MRDNRFFQIIAVLGILLTPNLSVSQESSRIVTVVVWGESPIQEGNIAQARELALQDGFTQAVIQVLGVHISTQSFMENYVSIEQSLLHQDYGKSINTKTRGYIKTYEIIETAQQPDNLRLKLKIVVSEDPIKNDLTALGIVLDAMGNPIIKLRGADEGLESSRSVAVFKPILAAKGFYLIESVPGKQSDVIIKLRGIVSNLNNIGDSGLVCAVVELQAEVRQQGSQKIVSSKHNVSNGCGLNEIAALRQAYERAAETLAPEMIDSVAEIWGREVTSGRDIELTVGVSDYKNATVFTKYLGRVFGVKKVDLKSFQDGKAHYIVRFTGQSQTLADLILKMPLWNFEVSVQGIAADSIALLIE